MDMYDKLCTDTYNHVKILIDNYNVAPEDHYVAVELLVDNELLYQQQHISLIVDKENSLIKLLVLLEGKPEVTKILINILLKHKLTNIIFRFTWLAFTIFLELD